MSPAVTSGSQLTDSNSQPSCNTSNISHRPSFPTSFSMSLKVTQPSSPVSPSWSFSSPGKLSWSCMVQPAKGLPSPSCLQTVISEVSSGGGGVTSTVFVIVQVAPSSVRVISEQPSYDTSNPSASTSTTVYGLPLKESSTSFEPSDSNATTAPPLI